MGVQFKLPRVSYQARWPTVFKNCIKNYRLKILTSVVAKAKTRSIPTNCPPSKTATTDTTDHNFGGGAQNGQSDPGEVPNLSDRLNNLTHIAIQDL